MKELSVREMRASYQVFEKALKDEGEIVLTHHGKPFARVLPYETAEVGPKRLSSLKWLRDQMRVQKTGSEALIREDRDARD